MIEHIVSYQSTPHGTQLQFPSVYNAATTFIDRHPAEGRGEKVVLRTTGGESVTYEQLARRVNRCGNLLRARGVQPAERVLMIVQDEPAFLYCFWGTIKAGIRPVPVNTLLRGDDFAYMLEDCAAAALVHSPALTGEVERALARSRHQPRLVLPTTGPGDSLAAGMEEASPSLQPAPAAPEDDCFWLYSSGSTGRPKGAVHCHRSIAMSCQYYAVETLGYSEDDVSYSAAKLFFAYGMGNAMTFPLWVGGSTVLSPDRPTPELTFDIIERFRPTIFFGVPTLYAAQLKGLEQQPRDLSSLRLCVSAGEALPVSLWERWHRLLGVEIIEGMGTTESTHIFVSNRPGRCKPGYAGQPLTGYEARIVDEGGHDVPVGEPGELLIHCPTSALYYWNKPEKTAQTMLGDGWMRTGDMVVRDEEGFLRVSGRNDDMLKVGGIWVSPFEIEARLLEHPLVLEAAVVARKDEETLVKPEAWVVLKDCSTAGDEVEQALREHCKQGLAPYKYPRWFHFVEELPKTATGKIQRMKLRQRQEA